MDRKKYRLPGRELIGFVLLVLLLLGSLFTSFWLGRHHDTLARELENAAWCALRQDWQGASESYGSAMTRWRQKWSFCAVFSDHAPMQQIDNQLAQLKIYAAARDASEFAAVCTAVCQDLRSLADSHKLRLWNVM